MIAECYTATYWLLLELMQVKIMIDFAFSIIHIKRFVLSLG